MFIGFFVGLVLGKPMEGATIGATIGLIYLGQISVGNVIASNAMVGATIGVTFALASGLDAESAVTIAVPASLIATAVSPWLQPVSLAFGTAISNSFRQKNYNRAHVLQITCCWVKIAIWTILMTLVLVLGSDVVTTAISNLPDWATTGIRVAGRALPAVGIALGLAMVGGGGRILYMIIAFVLAKQTGMSTLSLALIAAMFGGVMIFNRIASGELDSLIAAFKAPKKERAHILKNRDVYLACYRVVAFETRCKPVDKYGGIAFMCSIFPVLRKLYPNDPDRAYEEVLKHDCYYNTSTEFNGIVMAPVCAMEEERAMGHEDEITPETIQGFKASMMGPVAGVGDPLGQGTLDLIFKTVGISMVLGGSILGVFVQYFGILGWCYAATFGLAVIGWKYGSDLISKLLDGGAMKIITDVGGLVGCVAFGALASSAITVSCGLTIAGVSLQETLFDAILPGMLSLIFLLICYNVLSKKKIGVFKLILIVFAVFFVLGALGILA